MKAENKPRWVSLSATITETEKSICSSRRFPTTTIRFIRNDGGNNFSDVSYKAGLADPTFRFSPGARAFSTLTTIVCWIFLSPAGMCIPEVDKQDWGTTWAERPQLFRNLDGVKFQEVPPATGSGLATVVTARGAAFGDLFNDGHIDVVLNYIESSPCCFATSSRTEITGWV